MRVGREEGPGEGGRERGNLQPETHPGSADPAERESRSRREREKGEKEEKGEMPAE